ncbi:MAG: glutaminyl-peptide cyclotransferase [Rikenellaceae bacterium]|nr:glutaminyl-peptide cyclotransferase [Rikenellaceae bacterium]
MKYAITSLLIAVSLVSCGGRSVAGQTPPTKYGYRIVAEYPHDATSYTQGLFWHGGVLYESTGEYGGSAVMKVALDTGRATSRRELDRRYFGEGAALSGGLVYQLTWLEGTLLVYDAATLTPRATLTYSGEGWGLTTDGSRLYMSDGTANISVRDPATFRTERVIAVRRGGKPVEQLNELEWIDGRIWANLYITDYRQMTTPQVVVIDPATGNVESEVDFSGIYSRLNVTRSTDVMNGIAHDPATGRTFVTGKRWNKLFEIELVKK